MRLYACIQDNLVVKVALFSDEEIREEGRQYQIIIDIQERIVPPQVGWVYQDNKIILPELAGLTSEQVQIKKNLWRRDFGIQIKGPITDKLGARNIMLGKNSAFVMQMSSQLGPIGMLLESGAITTSRNALMSIRPYYAEHDDIFDEILQSINEYIAWIDNT